MKKFPWLLFGILIVVPGIALAQSNEPPTLEVNKYVVNDDGESALPGDFNLFIDGTLTATGDVNTLTPGVHQVTETASPYYYGIFGGDCDSNGYVTLNNGDKKLCVLTNDDLGVSQQPPPKGVLIVKKQVINDNGGTKIDLNFSMYVTADHPSMTMFPGSSYGVAVTVNPGAYSVDEQYDSGYTKTLSADCAGTILSGETKVCTITNNDIVSGGGGGSGDEEERIAGGRRTPIRMPSDPVTEPTPPSEPAPESEPDVEPTPASNTEPTPVVEPTVDLEPIIVSEVPPLPKLEIVAASECGIYLNEYIHKDKDNNPDEVRKLQIFLNEYMNTDLDISGLYDTLTFNAVKDFQVKESKEILEPWGITEPTGYVYKTTRRRINMIICSDLNLPMPTPLIADTNIHDNQ